MKRGVLIGLIMGCLSAPVLAETDQQTKMKNCNADAKQQNLTGDKRKAFMQTCLASSKDNSTNSETKAASATAKSKIESAKSDAAKPSSDLNKEGKPLTAQQQRMKNCNAEAKAKELKGDPRKAFMKSCLSNKN